MRGEKTKNLDAVEQTKNIVTSFAIKKPLGKSGFSSPPKIEPHKVLGVVCKGSHHVVEEN